MSADERPRVIVDSLSGVWEALKPVGTFTPAPPVDPTVSPRKKLLARLPEDQPSENEQ